MKCQDYYCLLLGMTCAIMMPSHQSAGLMQLWPCSVSQWPLARLVQPPGPPTNTLASLAECKQDTNDKVKAYLTDIIWIITRSLVLR